MTKVRLCFHDRCFDGTASAALFFRFYRECQDANAEFLYTGMTHKASKPFEHGLFDGDENVIVDFKYSSSPQLTWWFDHHQSAFLTSEDARHFREDHTGKKALTTRRLNRAPSSWRQSLRRNSGSTRNPSRSSLNRRYHRWCSVCFSGGSGGARRTRHAAGARDRGRARTESRSAV